MAGRGADGRRVSSLNLVGKGRFTPLTGIAGRAWVDAGAAMDRPYLRTLVVGAPGALDSYCSWQELREVDEAGAILVRPDGVIAWRQHAAASDMDAAKVALERALAALLDAEPVVNRP